LIGEALGKTRQSAREHYIGETRLALATSVAKNDDLTEVEAMAIAVDEVSASRRARRQRAQIGSSQLPI
jgi:hypothetical protein